MTRRYPSIAGAGPLVALLVGGAAAAADTTGGIPEQLKPPPAQVLSTQMHAVGVQIYGCQPSKADPTRFEWTFIAPEADLFDPAGKAAGRHYAGPTWEARDGSKVVGEVVARDAGPDPAAIPWLLLRATSAAGHGVLNQTQSIQRLHTSGGKAPAEGCTQARKDDQVRVPYTADYVFFK